MNIKTYFILFSLVFFAGHNAFTQPEGTHIDGVVAIVGKNVVLFSDIESQYAQSVMQSETGGSKLRCEILEELMLQNLLLSQAQYDSLTVSDNEVETELERRLRFFISQIGSREALEKYYNKSILEIKDEFREIIKDQLLVQKMQQEITGEIKVTPSEVKKYYNGLAAEEIPTIELEFQLAHLVIMPVVSDEVKEIVRVKMIGLRDRVIKGDDFGTLAVMYSEDPGSAKKRGELGFFGRGEMFPEFEAAAFRLQTPGEISPIIETKAGFHILQLIERRGELVNVRHILLMVKPGVQEMMNAKNKIDSIYVMIERGEISFDEAVKKYSTDKSSSNGGLMVNSYTMDNKFPASHLDASVLFTIEKLEPGHISNVITYKDEENNSGYRILYVMKKTPPHTANLQDDYPLIQELALEKKKQEALNDWIFEKKSYTFIKISEQYKNCTFKFDW